MDDDLPVRRSLRVAGMTPLRPKSYVYDYRTGRSRSRSRSSSQTPLKNERAKNGINLPSDLSTSDFLGDTPTARFHRALAQQPPTYPNTIETINVRSNRDLATVVARRIAQPEAVNDLAAPPTIKARRVIKSTSNVFLSTGEKGFLSVTLRGIWNFVRGALSSFFDYMYRVLAGNASPRLLRVIFMTLLILGVIVLGGFQLSKVDLKKLIPSSLPRRSSSNPTFEFKAETEALKRLETALFDTINMVSSRVDQLEGGLRDSKSLISGVSLSITKDFEDFHSKLVTIRESEVLLNNSLEDVKSELKSIKEATGDDERLSDIESRIKSIESAVQKLFDDIPQMISKISTPEPDLDVLERRLMERIGFFRKDIHGNVVLDQNLVESIIKQVAAQVKFTQPAIDLEKIQQMVSQTISKSEPSLSADSVVALINEQLRYNLVEFQETEEKKFTEAIMDVRRQVSDVERRQSQTLTSEQELLKIKSQMVLSSVDGVGMADWALESMGSRPVLSLTSGSYREDHGFFSNIFKLQSSRPPRIALNPNNFPGNCWASDGPVAILTVALGTPVIPTHFSIDHIPKEFNLDRSSAPKECKIYAFNQIGDESTEVAHFQYDLTGPAVQTFAANPILGFPVKYLRLEILTNHGKEEFTCLYRFRVHSDPSISQSPIFGDSQ